MQAQLLNWYRTGGLRASRLWAEPSSVDHTASIAFPVQCAALQSPRGIFQDCNCVWLQPHMQFSLVKNMHFHLAINMHFPIPMSVHKLPSSVSIWRTKLSPISGGKILDVFEAETLDDLEAETLAKLELESLEILEAETLANLEVGLIVKLSEFRMNACRTEHAHGVDNYGSRMTYCCMRPIPQVRPPMSHVVCGQYLGRL